ncbi:dienelactone hydrolase family protein [Paraburkholderia sp. BR14263]|uniref:dienelactone hydrolase family protein n=1 Tax=unclassified Paraburkholderia TaxID=2615204 RepID=UPI0034CE2100
MSRGGRRRFIKLAAAGTILAGTSAGADGPGIRKIMPDQSMQKLGFSSYNFTDGAFEHTVYVKGAGPVVIVMHELPGFNEYTVRFVDRLVEHGFGVHAPHLYGPMMWSASILNYARLCISKEFGYLRTNRSAPVCDWLRALSRSLAQDNSIGRIGLIGMCLTGAFVIPVVIETGVHAGIISQPAIPISLRYVATSGSAGDGDWMREMNVSNADLESAAKRCARDGVAIMVQRFKNDVLSVHPRVERIVEVFGSNATLHEYDNSGTDPHPHAILTYEYDAAGDDDPVNSQAPNSTRVALQRVVAFLHENLDVQPT